MSAHVDSTGFFNQKMIDSTAFQWAKHFRRGAKWFIGIQNQLSIRLRSKLKACYQVGSFQGVIKAW